MDLLLVAPSPGTPCPSSSRGPTETAYPILGAAGPPSPALASTAYRACSPPLFPRPWVCAEPGPEQTSRCSHVSQVAMSRAGPSQPVCPRGLPDFLPALPQGLRAPPSVSGAAGPWRPGGTPKASWGCPAVHLHLESAQQVQDTVCRPRPPPQQPAFGAFGWRGRRAPRRSHPPSRGSSARAPGGWDLGVPPWEGPLVFRVDGPCRPPCDVTAGGQWEEDGRARGSPSPGGPGRSVGPSQSAWSAGGRLRSLRPWAGGARVLFLALSARCTYVCRPRPGPSLVTGAPAGRSSEGRSRRAHRAGPATSRGPGAPGPR